MVARMRDTYVGDCRRCRAGRRSGTSRAASPPPLAAQLNRRGAIAIPTSSCPRPFHPLRAGDVDREVGTGPSY